MAASAILAVLSAVAENITDDEQAKFKAWKLLSVHSMMWKDVRFGC